jgi:hypothetical protein
MHPINHRASMASEEARRTALRQVKLSFGLMAITMAGMAMAGAGLFSQPSAPSRLEPQLEIAIEPTVPEAPRARYRDAEMAPTTILR